MMRRRICVFCGSAFGADPAFRDAAARLGRRVAERGMGLVYGGASVGLMGVVADAALEAGGEVIGVLPRFMETRELGHRRLTELRLVESMHERKAHMTALADGFVTLPGGAGTLEELFEVWTWVQIGLHRKPIGLLEVADYYAPLLAFLDASVAAGFLRPENRRLLHVARDPDALLDQLLANLAPEGATGVNQART